MTRPDHLSRFTILSLLLISIGLSACASKKSDDGPPRTGSSGKLPPDAVPREEPRSRYGNPDFYEVYGVRYAVMDSSYGYEQRGVASWYGKKFHGRKTSSQEQYDMYAMTAAHKSLPLPTYVRVRNLRNNKSIVVRVNDRGPFVDNRIIDLSYSAAIKLDMISSGTALVEVTALSYDDPPPTAKNDAAARTTTTSVAAPDGVYVQVGAFGDVNNAKRRFALIRDSGIDGAFVHKDQSRTPALYRIRIGPVGGVDHYDALVIKLASIGVTESHLVTN